MEHAERITKNRLKVIHALTTTKRKQCRDKWRDGNAVCATELCRTTLKLKDVGFLYRTIDFNPNIITQMNDGGMNFRQIGTTLSVWWNIT